VLLTPARRRLRELPFFLFTAVLVLLVLVPFVWVLASSLKPTSEIFSVPVRLLPRSPTLAAYQEALGMGAFRRYFLNSTLLSSVTVLLNLALGAPAAFAFARLRFRFRRALLLSVLATQLFPAAMLVIPLYIIWGLLNLFNTYLALVLTYLVFSLPLTIWMLTAFFRQVPVEIEEAARIDGCSRLGAFWRVILPLTRPGMVVVAIYAAVMIWQEFLFAASFTSSDEVRPLSVGLFLFIGEYSVQWNLLMASAVVLSLPVVLVFLLLQRYFIQGIAAGAVK